MPTISLYEVFKRVLHQRDEGQALRAAAVMLATARAYNALLWTQGADFEGMEGIRSAMSQPPGWAPARTA